MLRVILIFLSLCGCFALGVFMGVGVTLTSFKRCMPGAHAAFMAAISSQQTHKDSSARS